MVVSGALLYGSMLYMAFRESSSPKDSTQTKELLDQKKRGSYIDSLCTFDSIYADTSRIEYPYLDEPFDYDSLSRDSFSSSLPLRTKPLTTSLFTETYGVGGSQLVPVTSKRLDDYAVNR